MDIVLRKPEPPADQDPVPHYQPNTTVFVPQSPSSISSRQFFHQLAVMGKITNDEAMAFVTTGTIPASMLTLINGLPVNQQFAAKMMIIGDAYFNRNNPLVAQLGAAYGMTPSDIDALWTAAAKL